MYFNHFYEFKRCCLACEATNYMYSCHCKWIPFCLLKLFLKLILKMSASTFTHAEFLIKCYFWKAENDRVAYSYIAMADQDISPFKFALNIFFLISQWKVLLQRRYGLHFQEHSLNCRGIGWAGIFIYGKNVMIRRPHWPFYGHHIYPESLVLKRGTFLLLLHFQ